MSPLSNRDTTLIRNAICNPEDPRHFMEIDTTPRSASAYINGTLIAQSDAPRIAREVGLKIYDPVVYFPLKSIVHCHLTQTTETTHCPLKGTASYFDIALSGFLFQRSAWIYQISLGF